VRAGVEPGHAASELFDDELSAPQIFTIDVGDLQLAARRRLQIRGDVDHLIVIKIQPRHRIGRSGLRRLFFEADRPSLGVEFDNAVTFRIANEVAEHRGALGPFARGAEHVGEAVAEENVVAERQRDAVVTDEVPAKNERMGEAVGAFLDGVGEPQAEITAVAEQAHEAGLVLGRGDDQDVLDARQHQRRQRVVDHRLVVDRHELLADAARNRIQARPAAARQNDPFQQNVSLSSGVDGAGSVKDLSRRIGRVDFGRAMRVTVKGSRDKFARRSPNRNFSSLAARLNSPGIALFRPVW
jgi:hypothetical protein